MITDQQINEKLAELCGIPHMIDKDLQVWWYRPELDTVTEFDHRVLWNPIQDLNQLRECYEAAEKAYVIKHPEIDFDSDFSFCLRNLLVEKGIVNAVSIDLATAWIKHPRIVALAILKAAGVEVE